MGFSLEIGELYPDAWDWITFNNRNEGTISPEVLDGASLLIPLRVQARDPDSELPAATPYQAARSGILTFFPVAKSEDGILGCCLNSITACMGWMLNLGSVVGERGYAKCSGRYPRTVFSALFDSGYVVITDSGLEDLRTAGRVRSIIVHPDDPDTVRRPIEVNEVRCCLNCALPLSECECAEKEMPITAKSLERSWKSLEHLELRERIIAFQKMRHNSGLFRSTLTTTKDATWFSKRPGTATLKQVGMTVQSDGPLLQKMKVSFACRLARQSSPRGLLVSPDDRPAAVQATRRGKSAAKASTAGLTLSCEICGANFSRRSGLHRHRRTVHEAVRDFPCAVCGKAFTLRQHLQTHVEAVHEKRRDHLCEECGVSFPTASKLSRHTRGVHLREKSLQCELCGRLFFQHSDLLRHQRRNDHAPTTAGAEQTTEL